MQEVGRLENNRPERRARKKRGPWLRLGPMLWGNRKWYKRGVLVFSAGKPPSDEMATDDKVVVSQGRTLFLKTTDEAKTAVEPRFVSEPTTSTYERLQTQIASSSTESFSSPVEPSSISPSLEDLSSQRAKDLMNALRVYRSDTEEDIETNLDKKLVNPRLRNETFFPVLLRGGPGREDKKTGMYVHPWLTSEMDTMPLAGSSDTSPKGRRQRRKKKVLSLENKFKAYLGAVSNHNQRSTARTSVTPPRFARLSPFISEAGSSSDESLSTSPPTDREALSTSHPHLGEISVFVTAGCLFAATLLGVDHKGATFPLIQHKINFNSGDKITDIILDEREKFHPYEIAQFDFLEKMALLIETISPDSKAATTKRKLIYHLPDSDYVLYGLKLWARGLMSLEVLDKLFIHVMQRGQEHRERIKEIFQKNHNIEVEISSPFESFFHHFNISSGSDLVEVLGMKQSVLFTKTGKITTEDRKQAEQLLVKNLINALTTSYGESDPFYLHQQVWKDLTDPRVSKEQHKIKNFESFFHTANAMMVALAARQGQERGEKVCSILPANEKPIAVKYGALQKNFPALLEPPEPLQEILKILLEFEKDPAALQEMLKTLVALELPEFERGGPEPLRKIIETLLKFENNPVRLKEMLGTLLTLELLDFEMEPGHLQEILQTLPHFEKELESEPRKENYADVLALTVLESLASHTTLAPGNTYYLRDYPAELHDYLPHLLTGAGKNLAFFSRGKRSNGLEDIVGKKDLIRRRHGSSEYYDPSSDGGSTDIMSGSSRPGPSSPRGGGTR